MKPLSVDVIAMEFPCPSETFAGNDVRSLSNQGVDVSVRNLRPAIADAVTYLSDWELQNLSITHLNRKIVFNTLYFLITKPHWWIFLFYWLVKNRTFKPEQLLKSLVLMPRSVEIAAEIQQKNPQIIHIFWGHYPCMVAAIVQRFMPSIKVSIFLGSYDLVMRYPGSIDVANKADSVWTHAKANIPDIRDMGVSNPNLHVVYRGIDFKKQSLVSQNLESKIPKSIISIGRLIKSKGFDQSIEILAKLIKQWPETTLTIIGEGEELQALQQKAKQLNVEHAVKFLGHLPHREVFNRVQHAEVFLLMSWLDGERLPNVVKEAILCRTLCVSTNTIGMEELIQNDSQGFIVPMHDVEKAYEKIHQIFSHQCNYQQITQNALDHLHQNFDLDRNMDQYIKQWSLTAQEV